MANQLGVYQRKSTTARANDKLEQPAKECHYQGVRLGVPTRPHHHQYALTKDERVYIPWTTQAQKDVGLKVYLELVCEFNKIDPGMLPWMVKINCTRTLDVGDGRTCNVPVTKTGLRDFYDALGDPKATIHGMQFCNVNNYLASRTDQVSHGQTHLILPHEEYVLWWIINSGFSPCERLQTVRPWNIMDGNGNVIGVFRVDVRSATAYDAARPAFVPGGASTNVSAPNHRIRWSTSHAPWRTTNRPLDTAVARGGSDRNQQHRNRSASRDRPSSRDHTRRRHASRERSQPRSSSRHGASAERSRTGIQRQATGIHSETPWTTDSSASRQSSARYNVSESTPVSAAREAEIHRENPEYGLSTTGHVMQTSPGVAESHRVQAAGASWDDQNRLHAESLTQAGLTMFNVEEHLDRMFKSIAEGPTRVQQGLLDQRSVDHMQWLGH